MAGARGEPTYLYHFDDGGMGGLRWQRGAEARAQDEVGGGGAQYETGGGDEMEKKTSTSAVRPQ